MLSRRTFNVVMISAAAATLPSTADAQLPDAVLIRMRIDESVRGSIPTALLPNLKIESDSSDEARELARRTPAGKAAPLILIVVGAMTVSVVLQMINDLLRQVHYGGVLIDMRTKPTTVTSNPKIPGNMVFVTDTDGKTTQYKSDQLSPDLLRQIWGAK